MVIEQAKKQKPALKNIAGKFALLTMHVCARIGVNCFAINVRYFGEDGAAKTKLCERNKKQTYK